MQLKELPEDRDRNWWKPHFCGALARFWDHALVGLLFVSLDGHIDKSNAKMAELLGYSEGELEDLTFQKITHPADLDADIQNVIDLIDGKRKKYIMLKRYITKLEKTLLIKLCVIPLVNESGECVGFLAQVIPIELAEKVNGGIEKQPSRISPQEVGEFIASNWKWMLPLLSAIAYIIFEVLYRLGYSDVPKP